MEPPWFLLHNLLFNLMLGAAWEKNCQQNSYFWGKTGSRGEEKRYGCCIYLIIAK